MGCWVATTKPAMVATEAAERSIPPVYMVMVWQAASMASGIANLTVLATQRGLRIPGCIISSAATRAKSSRISGMTGQSRIRRARRASGVAGERVMGAPI